MGERWTQRQQRRFKKLLFLLSQGGNWSNCCCCDCVKASCRRSCGGRKEPEGKVNCHFVWKRKAACCADLEANLLLLWPPIKQQLSSVGLLNFCSFYHFKS